MPAKQIRNRITIPIWNQYFKFCTVRNPYDKVVSWFYMHLLAKEKQRLAQLPLESTVQVFHHWLVVAPRLPIDRDKYIVSGRLCVDDVIRYETLHDDLRKVCDRVGVPFEPDRVPDFKRGTTGRTDASWRPFYDEDTVEIVNNAFAREFDLFGYEKM